MGAVKKNCAARDCTDGQDMLAADFLDTTYVLADDSVKKVPGGHEQSALGTYCER